MSDFMPLSIDLLHDYRPYQMAAPVHSADYTFTNLWGWAEQYGLTVALRSGYALIHQARPYDCYWAPVGDWNQMDLAAIPEFAQGAQIHRVPEEFVAKFQTQFAGRVQETEARGQWEYLYSREELATLSGKRFHKKKNHVNAFYKAYGEDYRALTPRGEDGIIEDVLALQEDWCRWRDCENSLSLQAENDVIFRVVGNWRRLEYLVGGSLYCNGSMAAFAIGEPLDDDNFVVHFEKVQPDYRGVYQAINNAFAVHAAEGFQVLNQEQDMDEEGLRQAKETYNPTGFLKKSSLVIA